MKVQRTHDQFYLQENRYKSPKKLHLDIIEMIKAVHSGDESNITICDFGCAAGEFEYALHQHFPRAKITGFDVLEVLLEKARREVPVAVTFAPGSILERHICPASSVDFSLSTGVLSIFDRFEVALDNLIYWTKDGGSVFIHSLFNKEPVDVFIKYCLSADYGADTLESGWNIFSQQSVGKWLAQHPKVAKFEFLPFSLDLDLQRNESDPARSWTFEDKDGTRHITNGLCLLQPHAILSITVKK